MRSRTIREGSVGLLILAGLAVFGGLVVWIRGLSLGNRSYEFIASFADVAGMQGGATVRYRGVSVGEITKIEPGTNGVEVTIEISPADLLIPRDVIIEANQAGLIGETTIDISPVQPLPADAQSLSPFGSRCDSDRVICNGDRLQGQIGVSFIELLRSSTRLTALYTDPAFFNNLNSLTTSAADAAKGVTQLTGELAQLTRSVRQEVRTFSTTTNAITATTTQTANRIGNAADQFSLTATQLNQLAVSANELVSSNRENLSSTLNSVRGTSDQLQVLLGNLAPTLEQVNSTLGQVDATTNRVNFGELLGNLQTLSANAAEASANLRDISSALNTPANVLVLQQTLDSARATFENAQKITADLDELTGDPAFRNNLKDLVNGLGSLVSSTEQLQQQVQVAQEVEAVSAALNSAALEAASAPANQPVLLNPEQGETTRQPNQQQSSVLLPPAPKKAPNRATSQFRASTGR